MERDEAAVVVAADAEDVADLVRFAQYTGIRVATEAVGRAEAGADTVEVSISRLNRISVCPRSRTARVGAGVSAGDLAAAVAPHGLVAMCGGSAHERVVDLALGGGIGWFARKYGIASDEVTAFEVVDAYGNLLRASAHENEDLFWALSGGGDGFAFVTAVETRLHAEPELFGGTLAWPAAAAREVFAVLEDVVAAAPEELTVWATVSRVPGTPATVSVSSAFLGPEEEGRVLLKPFVALGGEAMDTRAAVGIPGGGAFACDPVQPIPGRSRAELLSGLDDAALDVLLDPADPLLAVQVRQLGGRLAEASAKGPHGAISGRFAVFLAGSGARQAEAVAALGGSVTGRKPLAWLGSGEPVSWAFGAGALDRLREVKAAWDPAGVFAGRDLD
jgi:FAD/FMN-containing dehydrogenase